MIRPLSALCVSVAFAFAGCTADISEPPGGAAPDGVTLTDSDAGAGPDSPVPDDGAPDGEGDPGGPTPDEGDAPGAPDGSPDGAPDAPGDVDPGPGALLQSVYERLRPTCFGCHIGAWDKGFFDSFDAFQNLLVFAKDGAGDPRYVVPGDPDASTLVALLEGVAPGNYPQMPLDKPFAAYEAAGDTLITLEEIRDWIAGMGDEVPTVDDEAPTDLVLVRRVRADQLVRLMREGLGLTDEDFWGMANNYGYYEVIGYGQSNRLPIADPSGSPEHGVNSNIEAQSNERWFALGGPDYLNGRSRSQDLSPAFVQTLTQVSQTWCRVAVTKSGNTAILGELSLSDSSADAEAAIRDNIARLHLRLLGEPATPQEVDDLFAKVFQVYESFSDREAAWTAVCAVLVRDPRFITY